MEEQAKYTAKNPKKKLVYEYWFAYADRCNKLQNALADCNYEINSRERMRMAQDDLRRITGDNFKAFYNYKLLRKKYIDMEVKKDK